MGLLMLVLLCQPKGIGMFLLSVTVPLQLLSVKQNELKRDFLSHILPTHINMTWQSFSFFFLLFKRSSRCHAHIAKVIQIGHVPEEVALMFRVTAPSFDVH